MGKAKDLIVKPIKAKDANRVIKRLHYSGKVVQNSQVHLGVFLDGKCGGAMQFGPSMCKRLMLGLVDGTKWNEFIELNRMAFADWLPRNGESRCIGYAMRWFKKTYPHIKWVVSFADGAQCGDGTIYRASGFVLTHIGPISIWEAPDGTQYQHATIAARGSLANKEALQLGAKMNKPPTQAFIEHKQLRKLSGVSLRYIYFIDPTARDRLTVPILPFSEIDKRGVGMYKGKQRKQGASSETSDTPDDQSGKGGATPTDALH